MTIARAATTSGLVDDVSAPRVAARVGDPREDGWPSAAIGPSLPAGVIMVDMRYGSAGLDSGAGEHERFAQQADDIVTLFAVPATAAVYGSTPSAANLLGTLERARLGCGARVMRQIAERGELDRRVGRTAELGRELDASTTATADGGGRPEPAPGGLAERMGGG